MSDPSASEKVQVEIPYGVVEFTATFKKPILKAWLGTALIIEAVLDALEPFGFQLDGVDVKTQMEKLTDYAVVFKRSTPGVTLTLQLGRLVIVAENLDWTEAQHSIATAQVAVDTILQHTKAEIAGQNLLLALHIQLKAKPREDVMAPLLSPNAFKLMDGDIRFPGVILQREKSSVVIDASLAFANGLFVRINRQHGPEVTLTRMSEMLLADEKKLFEVLGLEGSL
jgi:hypothetical protein